MDRYTAQTIFEGLMTIALNTAGAMLIQKGMGSEPKWMIAVGLAAIVTGVLTALKMSFITFPKTPYFHETEEEQEEAEEAEEQ